MSRFRPWQNVGFFAVAVVLVYCVIGSFDPPRLNWGDTASDYNTMISGRNFAKYGFVGLRFTPNLLDTAVMERADSNLMYTHYPQLPDLANGAMRTILGFPDDVVPFRFAAMLFSFGSLFFVYGLATAYWSRQVAQVTLALWATNPLWIQHADYLHHGPYGAFFGFGSVYFLVRSLAAERRRTLLYVLSGAFLFLAYCSSYDYWIFTPLLLAAVTAHRFGMASDRRVALTLGGLSLFALAAIAAKAAVNIWALGGIDGFLRDLRFQTVERSTDAIMRNSFSRGMWPTLVGRVQRHFTLLLFPLVVFWLSIPILRRIRRSEWAAHAGAMANPAVVLIVALPFLALFRELWVGQYYPFLMVVPFYAIGFAAAFELLMKSGSGLARGVGILMLLALTANSVDETLGFKKAFFDRDAISRLRPKIDSLAKPGQWVLANHLFEAQYRYYFDRNAVPLMVHPPRRLPQVLAHFSDPNDPRFAGPNGAVLVQHKHITDEMFDKMYYHPLAEFNLWKAWGNPPHHRAFLDLFIAERDSTMGAVAREVGRKIDETDFYVLWLLPPSKPMTTPTPPVLQRFRRP